MTLLIILGFFNLAVSLTTVGVVLWDFFHPVIIEEEPYEQWTCENCGFTAIGATIEMVLEGMRQHDLLFPCNGGYLDDDDDV